MQLLALYDGFKVLERRAVAGVIFSEPGNWFFQDFSLSNASVSSRTFLKVLIKLQVNIAIHWNRRPEYLSSLQYLHHQRHLHHQRPRLLKIKIQGLLISILIPIHIIHNLIIEFDIFDF